MIIKNNIDNIENLDLKEFIGSYINNYYITKYINQGSFGVVFEAKDKYGDFFALKIPIQTETKNGQKCLLDEVKVYKCLNENIDNSEKYGIAKMKVIKNKDKKIIVMDLLGKSLESLLREYKEFRLKSIILLSIQLIDTMKYIHDCGYIHRDIKADNFVIGNINPHKIYCIDFGLAKKYIKKDTKHISLKKNYKFCGTARFASISAHLGHEQSRKDDLEAIGYLLIYLFRGSLPWMSIKNKDKKEKYRLIQEKKINTTEEELCDKLPRQFLIYMKYVKNLEFDERPQYTALKKMFQKLYDSKGYMLDKFEWEK